ncbi:RDD family protein [Microbulbifer agarilyticus]|uniref:RDD family protein n=1 Tax=Microbulbifer agarilyticus TaxID=260552 RepID=UPI001CD34CD9|nr:RDD family protein [Microbulbifer agarilyticus]MCA0895118.1 RDD family protein [Microbulbifer agarilyticus]
MDSSPDLENYNLQELHEAYFGINKKIYPDRAQEILDYIDQRKLSHPEEIPVPKVGVASRVYRLLAAIIDGAIAILAFIPIAVIVGPNYAESNPILYPFFALIYSYFVFLILNGFLLIDYGQTIGKKLVGISIRDLKGNIPSFNKLIFYRPLIKILFVVLSPLDLVNKLLIFRQDKRCLHDHIVATKVEYLPHA